MKPYQENFIDICLQKNVLKFGEFTLKSGRLSPYFFNAGLFNDGDALFKVADCYAQCLLEADIEFDVLFGPAYKGIPLVAAISTVLASKYNRNVGFAFNRKEKKDHGEGGQLVGANLENQRVVIVDDLITAGTAINESMELLNPINAKPCGILLALNRQEIGKNKQLSAVDEVKAIYQVPVVSIINFDDIINFSQSHDNFKEHNQALLDYRSQYGV
ncbi:orotate phosphoribosyltransferase [Thiotrichales bacterium 19S9-12]|nr:orotate phosphoribosyltransferase [Thiotrichales bacterium 19S9-11]MCF6811704.1 orotate phosphoribosyltransferase [Thiotrichales bacterium 19S9-12]